MHNRIVECGQLESATKTLQHEKLKQDKAWDKWHKVLCTYQVALLGSNCVPLIYVIPSSDEPLTGQVFGTYHKKTRVCASLTGKAFRKDARKVHFILTSLAQGGPGGQLSTPIAKFQHGRWDMQALYHHMD